MNNGDIMILETIAQANRERYAEIEKQCAHALKDSVVLWLYQMLLYRYHKERLDGVLLREEAL